MTEDLARQIVELRDDIANEFGDHDGRVPASPDDIAHTLVAMGWRKETAPAKPAHVVFRAGQGYAVVQDGKQLALFDERSEAEAHATGFGG